MSDLSGATTFADGIAEIVRLIGGDIDTLTNQFSALMNLSGRTIGTDVIPDTSINEVIDGLQEVADDSQPPTTTGKKFDSLGVESFAQTLDPATQGIIGTAGGSNVVITVNTGAVLGSEEDVQVAVVKALEQAKRKV